MSSHSIASSGSRSLCEQLEEALRSSIPEIDSVHRKHTCGFFRPNRNRFAYVFHNRSEPQIKVYLRGDPTIRPSDSSGILAIDVRPRIEKGWEKEFPYYFILDKESQVRRAADVLLTFSFPLSIKKNEDRPEGYESSLADLTKVPPELAQLYAELMASKFNFIPPGEHHLHDVHRVVKGRFPQLCDDTVLCKQTCTEGTGGPEWQHRVRAALQALKSSSGPVVKSLRRGYWTFNADQGAYPDEVNAGPVNAEDGVLDVEGEDPGDSLNPEASAIEGEIVHAMRRHRLRESALRNKKIQSVLSASGGRLQCEVLGCGFDYFEVYGELGREFAHVHHKNPLGDRSAPSETKLSELAIVCANCHAMIHRGDQCRPLEGLIPGFG